MASRRRRPSIIRGQAGLNCAGVFALDYTAFAHGVLGGSQSAFLLGTGNVIDCQCWGRDNGFGFPSNFQFSNGLDFTIGT